jgi:anthranilate phosphoribosyltransferase
VIREALTKLVDGGNLTHGEASRSMRAIMAGEASPSQIGGFLTALRMKGETAEEIIAFATAMREFCHAIHPRAKGRIVDTCGTGGDRLNTFNVSTASAFVLAGAGATVAKHGNRSVTSRCGSADLMEALGLNLSLEPAKVQSLIERLGIGFIYAPVFHPAMRHAVEPRRELGFRTVFNLLGPLANPAKPEAQLLGVYDQALTEPAAYTLMKMGCEEAMVVHGLDGLDEVSTVGRTKISWLKDGEVTSLVATPRDFGVKPAQPEGIMGGGPDASVETVYRVLNGLEGGARRDLVVVNSSAGLTVAGLSDGFHHGVELAAESIESGAAYRKLRGLVEDSGGDVSRLEGLESRYG